MATHAVTSSPPPVGVERDDTVYELFVSTLPSQAFTSSDVLDLYLHRGSFETILADEDVEQILTDGVPISPMDRNSGKSWANGSGIFAWNWGRRSPFRSPHD